MTADGAFYLLAGATIGVLYFNDLWVFGRSMGAALGEMIVSLLAR